MRVAKSPAALPLLYNPSEMAALFHATPRFVDLNLVPDSDDHRDSRSQRIDAQIVVPRQFDAAVGLRKFPRALPRCRSIGKGDRSSPGR